MRFSNYQRQYPDQPMWVSLVMYLLVQILSSLAVQALRGDARGEVVDTGHLHPPPTAPKPTTTPATPVFIGTPNPNNNLTCSMFGTTVDIQDFTDLLAGLTESDIEERLQRSTLNDRHSIILYFRMAKFAARLVEPAMERYIVKASPAIESALSSSQSLIAHLNLLDSSGSHGFLFKDLELEDAVSSTIDAYTEIWRDLGPQDDALYRILYIVQWSLDDLAAVLSESSSTVPCEVGVISSVFQWYSTYLIGTEKGVQGFETCSQNRLIHNELVDLIEAMNGAVDNLREYLDIVQSQIDDLGNHSIDLLLAGAGRKISRKQYISIISSVTCDRVYLDDLLTVLSQ